MARLHEYEAKRLLRTAGIETPRGEAARTPDDAARVASDLGGSVVVKVQASVTGRKAMGGVAFADSPEGVREAAGRMLAMRVGQFPVERVLVEERLSIAHELFVSLSIDDRARRPVLLLAMSGGSGIEERAGDVARIGCSPSAGPDGAALDRFLASTELDAPARARVRETALRVFELARSSDARSLEINPLAVLTDGRVVALDARATIDDYAVFRRPELGIEIARELDHPPTELERIAYRVEQEDHRGTFFFAQMNTRAAEGSKGLVGFHGAGGGGSMMSMDAVTGAGFTVANFTDTSGNPSAAKVYRAARIILAQPGLVGYFGSGSGVASQEQFWSAYGLAKAFWELDIDIPVVVRLGGNTEDRAVDILREASGLLRTPVEGYKKNDTPARIAGRFAELVAASSATWKPRPPRAPDFVRAPGAVSWPIRGGTLWVDPVAWRSRGTAIAARSSGLLRDEGGRPVVTVSAQEIQGKDSELIACEVECRHAGFGGVFVELAIPGL